MTRPEILAAMRKARWGKKARAERQEIIDRIRPSCECHGEDLGFRKITSCPLDDGVGEAKIAHFACTRGKPWHYEYRLWPDGNKVTKVGPGQYGWRDENGPYKRTRSRHPEAMASAGVRERISGGIKRAWNKPGYRARMAKMAKNRWRGPEYRARMTAHLRRMGHLPHIREQRRATAARLANDPNYKKVQAETAKRRWAGVSPRKRRRWVRNIRKGLSRTEVRKVISEKSKSYWTKHKAELAELRAKVAEATLANGNKPKGRRKQTDESRRYFSTGEMVEKKLASGMELTAARRSVASAMRISYSSVVRYHKQFRSLMTRDKNKKVISITG